MLKFEVKFNDASSVEVKVSAKEQTRNREEMRTLAINKAAKKLTKDANDVAAVEPTNDETKIFMGKSVVNILCALGGWEYELQQDAGGYFVSETNNNKSFNAISIRNDSVESLINDLTDFNADDARRAELIRNRFFK